ncbi:Uncharacterised protein g3933 [Pycnogonum litorale]
MFFVRIVSVAIAILACICQLTDGVSFSASRPHIRRDFTNKRQFYLDFKNEISDSQGAFIEQFGAFNAPYQGHYAFHLCVPRTNRFTRIGLYHFSGSRTPKRILWIKPANGAHCYSVVIKMAANDFVYNVVERGRIPNGRQDFIFSGYIVGDSGPPSVAPRGKRPTSASFPHADALPENVNDDVEDEDENGDGGDGFRPNNGRGNNRGRNRRGRFSG